MDNAKSETKYERLRKIGIGSYGVVFKCVNRQTGQIVAIKRYSENDSDPVIRKIAMREVRMLRQLKHPNLIHLIEVFRRRRILHLVFDYCELTVLDVIEKYANNCPLNLIRKIIWQLVNGVSYCHSHNCIHRDIKPENILINQAGVVKLCDFGFARNLRGPGSGGGGSSGGSSGRAEASARAHQAQFEREAQLLGVIVPQGNERGGGASSESSSNAATNKENYLLAERQALTEYVATRWYRAPELLVGDIYYDTKIDIWAIGCVTAELMRGEPMWPGKTDLDQLFMIKSTLGQMTPSQTHNLLTQGLYDQANTERLLNQTGGSDPIERKLPARVGQLGVDFVVACLRMDPARRPPSEDLLQHQYIQSAQMSQFVKSATAQSASTNNVQALASSTTRLGQQQQQQQYASQIDLSRTGDHNTKHNLTTSGVQTVDHIAAGLSTRSNSQAILRVANTQQPASKRLVLAPRSSSGSSGSPRTEGTENTASSGQKRAHQQQLAQARHGQPGSLVPVPVRTSPAFRGNGRRSPQPLQPHTIQQSPTKAHKRKAAGGPTKTSGLASRLDPVASPVHQQAGRDDHHSARARSEAKKSNAKTSTRTTSRREGKSVGTSFTSGATMTRPKDRQVAAGLPEVGAGGDMNELLAGRGLSQSQSNLAQSTRRRRSSGANSILGNTTPGGSVGAERRQSQLGLANLGSDLNLVEPARRDRQRTNLAHYGKTSPGLSQHQDQHPGGQQATHRRPRERRRDDASQVAPGQAEGIHSSLLPTLGPKSPMNR